MIVEYKDGTDIRYPGEESSDCKCDGLENRNRDFISYLLNSAAFLLSSVLVSCPFFCFPGFAFPPARLGLVSSGFQDDKSVEI